MPRLDLVSGINLDADGVHEIDGLPEDTGIDFMRSDHVDPEEELLRRLESFVAHHGILEIDLVAKRADCGEIPA